MDYEVRFVTKRWDHHSTHSGYDQLVPRLGSPVKPIPSTRLRDKWIPGRVAVWLAARSGISLYSYLTFYQEWAAIRDVFSSSDRRIYHILYGDETFRYLGSVRRWPKTRLIATFHLPPSILDQVLHSKTHLKRLDGVIVVGRNQVPFFDSVVGSDRVNFIPHGVDTRVFTPSTTVQPNSHCQATCLFVGIHRRDFATLRQVIALVHSQNADIRFVVVTATSNRGYFLKSPNVQLLSDVPEVELIELYRSADLLLEPLEDSTANNAVLEGMACGLPIVATDIGAIRDYVDEGCSILVPPKNADAMADAVLNLLDNDERRGRLALHARQQALQFDWSVIVQQTRRVYSQLMAG